MRLSLNGGSLEHNFMAVTEQSLENLKNGKPWQFNSETGAAAGRISQKNRRNRKSMNDMIRMMASMPVSEGKLFDIEKAKSVAALSGKNLTASEAMGAQLFIKAMKGDAKAAAIVYPIISENEDGAGADIERAVGIASTNFWANIGGPYGALAGRVFKHEFVHYTLPGGRGSLKSSFISLMVVYLMMQNPMVHALVLRKVANTISSSVYSQYVWAINTLGVSDFWKFKTSPPELIFKPTGQTIMFRGADEPGKIKSIKVKFGYIGITHFEELDQFTGREETRNITQSTMRGGDLFWNFESFNPPITLLNWANKDANIEREDRIVFRSTYLDVNREWLGEQFFNEAEHLKEINENAYRHEYLGIPVGTGGNVFDNLELRRITDEEVERFDRIYQGLDWGWMPDPDAFIRLHYDSVHEVIYFIDEIYVNKTPNEELAEMLKEKHYQDAFITCDSAEPKSIADLRACGLPAKEAVKGPGSVDYGMKWLQKRKIVIDQQRTPNAYREFTEYEYERDKDGEIISGYPDRDNHLIDATRYALERVFGKYRSIG